MRLNEAGDKFRSRKIVIPSNGNLHGEIAIFVRFAKSVYAADGRDNDDVSPSDERISGGKAISFDFVVSGGIFFDICVSLRNVGFRLVVVVI